MINVSVALIIVLVTGGIGGLCHGLFFSDAPLAARKQEEPLMIKGNEVKVALRPISLLKEFGLGSISGLVFYGSTIAPGVVASLDAQVQLVLGSLAGIALVGMGGSSYLTSQIKERQWRKLDAAYDEKDDAFKIQVKRGVTNPVQALHAMSLR